MDLPAEHHDSAIDIRPEPLDGSVAQSLIATLNAELSALYPEPGATHFQLDPAQVAPGAGAFLVARRNGTPIGCGALRRITDASVVAELGDRVGELKRMFVAREGRGQGIGRALLARLETEARSLGLSRVVLETGIRQHEALALYRRAGYVDIPAYGEYSLSPGTSVCMAKALEDIQTTAAMENDAQAELDAHTQRIGIDWSVVAERLLSREPELMPDVAVDDVDKAVGSAALDMLPLLRTLPDGAGTEAFIAALGGE